MKHVHRFFTLEPVSPGQPVRLDDSDSFHALKVLRLGPGDKVELADGQGRVFEAVIDLVGSGNGHAVEAVAGDRLMEAEAVRAWGDLTVVQALPKGRKMDFIAEKLSEIGVARLVPAISDLSVARNVGGEGKTDRWRRVAKAAAAQSKRNLIMDVDEPVKLARWMELFDDKSAAVLVLATEIKGMPLGAAVTSLQEGGLIPVEGAPPAGKGIMLVVGPEAGFSQAELDLFKERGARFVDLGPLVLRTETAALVAATVIMHRLGVIG